LEASSFNFGSKIQEIFGREKKGGDDPEVQFKKKAPELFQL